MPGEDNSIDDVFEENVRLKRDLAKAEDKVLEWQRETTSASPGGSEYCSPRAMREYILMIRKDLHDNKVAKIRAERRVRDLEGDLRDASTLMKQLRAAENNKQDGPILPIY